MPSVSVGNVSLSMGVEVCAFLWNVKRDRAICSQLSLK